MWSSVSHLGNLNGKHMASIIKYAYSVSAILELFHSFPFYWAFSKFLLNFLFLPSLSSHPLIHAFTFSQEVFFEPLSLIHHAYHSQLSVPFPPSVQFSSVAQLCPTLCDLMNHSTPGLPVHHELLEFTQTHVPRVRDAVQPSHTRLSPSSPALNPSQHQSLFQ